ncbi:MAG: hypothetical protein ACM30G_02065 [Micromonosporaceae bacterium]
MPIRAGLVSTVETAAAVTTAVALACVVGMLVVIRALPAPARRPYHWLVGGVVTGVAGHLVAAGMIHQGARVTGVSAAVASLGVGAAIPLAGGLRGLLGPSAGRGPMLRHLVDGLIVGACIFFIGWLVFNQPAGRAARALPQPGLHGDRRAGLDRRVVGGHRRDDGRPLGAAAPGAHARLGRGGADRGLPAERVEALLTEGPAGLSRERRETGGAVSPR